MFKKFQSITNTKLKYLPHWQETHGDEKVVVTEKIHGANYQCSYDGTGFTVGSRSKQLGPKDRLYSDKTIREVFKDRVKLMYTLMKEQLIAQEQAALDLQFLLNSQGKHTEALKAYEDLRPSVSPTFRTLRVRGELYGGLYNHPEVADLPIEKVGKGGISYAQNASVAVFSVEVDDVALPAHDAKLLCFSVDLPTVPVVFMGTLDEAVEWSEAHIHDNTLIPNGTPWIDAEGKPVLNPQGEVQALPKIEGNEREGHVIRFAVPEFMADGREVIFKDINPNHAESKRKVRQPKVLNLTPLEQQIIDAVSVGFTKERMVTQFSYDNYDCKDMRLVIGKVVADCIGEAKAADLLVEFYFTKTPQADRKKVTNELNRLAFAELRDTFKELCK